MKALFIDDHIVEHIDNLARKLHPLQKFDKNVVLRPEHRWENCGIMMWTTPAWVPDEAVFKTLYYASSESDSPEVKLDVTGAPMGGKSFICYATSEDGVNWEKPPLGLYDYDALTWRGTAIGTENNILPTGVPLGPIYDPHDPDEQRRYKGMGWGKGGGLTPAISSDCLHWTYLDVPLVPSSDEAHFGYDEQNGLFIATVKHAGPDGRSPYGRSFCLSTSEDFENWSGLELIFHADQIDQENGEERIRKFIEDPDYLTPIYNRPEEWRTDVYNFPVFRYEGLYLGLPVMHHWTGKHPPLYENVDSRKSVELTSSRDLRQWERVANRTPFIELSPVGDGSAYDTGQISVVNGPLRRNNELWFYYLGARHRSQPLVDVMNRQSLNTLAMALAKLRVDGFVSLKGGIEWGSVLTKPLVVEGSELRVNVDSWRGRVKVEVLNADDGHPLPGYTFDESIPAMIDSIDEPVRWKEKVDLSEHRGRTVRLRFSILEAELYAFWFTD